MDGWAKYAGFEQQPVTALTPLREVPLATMHRLFKERQGPATIESVVRLWVGKQGFLAIELERRNSKDVRLRVI